MMHLKRILILLALTFSVVTSVQASTVGQALLAVGEVAGVAFEQLAKRLNITDQIAKVQFKSSLSEALKALNDGTLPANTKQLAKALSFDPQIEALIAKNIDEGLNPEDIVAMINKVNLRAELKGTRGALLCTTCMDDSLSAIGLRSMIFKSKITTSITKYKTRAAYKKGILKLAKNRKLRVADLRDLSDLKGMKVEDVKSLYVALKKSTTGTAGDKNLGTSIRLVNSDSKGKSYFMNNNLWRLMNSGLDEDEKNLFAALFRKVANESPLEEGGTRVPNLKVWLENKAKNNPELQEILDILKRKNCWNLF